MAAGQEEKSDSLDETAKLNGIKPFPTVKRRFKVNDSKQLSGDYSQLQVARHSRNMHVKDRQYKIFVAADEMSGRLIEEREMLSLGTRSRGTSRNTSRATSPTQTKKNTQLNTDDKKIMPPVVESRATSNISNRRADEIPVSQTMNDDQKEYLKEEDSKHVEKPVSKVKSKKKQKSKVVPSKDSQNSLIKDDSEHLLNESQGAHISDSKSKTKKTHEKQKSKHRKHKKHKKVKSSKIKDLTDSEMKDEDEHSEEDEMETESIEAEAQATLLNETEHSDESHLKGKAVILNDITNAEPNVPGTVNHVHFSDEITQHSRSGSVSDLDSKRG